MYKYCSVEASHLSVIYCMCFVVVQTVIQQAKSALENPRLTGEAEVKESEASRSGDQNLPPNQGFDMGQVHVHTNNTLHIHSPSCASNSARRRPYVPSLLYCSYFAALTAAACALGNLPWSGLSGAFL